jgi:L-cysteine:1D-myo-inositol 2-amino-2-deoxy-alpha-D-glucopyranoside ligase
MMRLYETSRGQVVPFEPGPIVTMYTCGITPYDAAHIGHAATYLAYDVLQRRLRDLGHVTQCVRNVTDVDDDILRKARELGVNFLDLAAEEMARFDADMKALGLLPAWSEPRATSAIPDILGFIGMVLDSGHAYQAGGAVYFSVGSFGHFGAISHFDRATMLRLAAENGGHPEDPNKRDPLDFVLWQPSAPGEPAWESLWGRGRPGWHIECSALAMRELGPTIDLHGGGTDLIFPHHECEAAQSEAATGQPFVRHWMHAGLVGLDGTKMSKSLGNLVFVSDLLKEWEPEVIRLAIIGHHYRSAWEWEDALLADATARLQAWQAAGAGDGALDASRAALDDDLDTPGAIAAIDAAAAAGHGVSAAAALLGVEY